MISFSPKKRRSTSTINLTKIATYKSKEYAKKLRQKMGSSMAQAARAWRAEMKVKLSGACATKRRPNYTDYPGRCSGNLERALTYRTFSVDRQSVSMKSVMTSSGVSVGNRTVVYGVYSGWSRQFMPTIKRGYDYSEVLNNRYANYGGYKERVYEALDVRIIAIMKRNTKKI